MEAASKAVVNFTRVQPPEVRWWNYKNATSDSDTDSGCSSVTQCAAPSIHLIEESGIASANIGAYFGFWNSSLSPHRISVSWGRVCNAPAMASVYSLFSLRIFRKRQTSLSHYSTA